MTLFLMVFICLFPVPYCFPSFFSHFCYKGASKIGVSLFSLSRLSISHDTSPSLFLLFSVCTPNLILAHVFPPPLDLSPSHTPSRYRTVRRMNYTK